MNLKKILALMMLLALPLAACNETDNGGTSGGGESGGGESGGGSTESLDPYDVAVEIAKNAGLPEDVVEADEEYDDFYYVDIESSATSLKAAMTEAIKYLPSEISVCYEQPAAYDDDGEYWFASYNDKDESCIVDVYTFEDNGSIWAEFQVYSLDEGGGEGDFEGSGTEDDPYSITDAYYIYEELEPKGYSEECYILGYVTDEPGDITVDNGRGCFYLTDGDNTIYVYNCNGFDGGNFNKTDIEVGGLVEVVGAVKKFATDDGNIFEFCYVKNVAKCELVYSDAEGGGSGVEYTDDAYEVAVSIAKNAGLSASDVEEDEYYDSYYLYVDTEESIVNAMDEAIEYLPDCISECLEEPFLDEDEDGEFWSAWYSNKAEDCFVEIYTFDDEGTWIQYNIYNDGEGSGGGSGGGGDIEGAITIDFSKFKETSGSVSGVTFTTDVGSNLAKQKPQYNSNKFELRLYVGNTITFTGMTFTSITFDANSCGENKADGTLKLVSGGGKLDGYTWTGSSNSVKFEISSGKQFHINSIIIK